MFVIIRTSLRRKSHTTTEFFQLAGSNIGGHNNHSILEINGSAIIVSKTPFIQYLQQDVENIRMRLLNFIKQHYGIRFAAYFLRQLSAFFITDISRSRTNHTRHRIFFHILTHIDTYQRIAGTEHVFSQLFCQVCFAYTGRTKKHKCTNGTIRVFQSYTTAQYCFGKLFNSSVLCHNLGLQIFFHASQFDTFRLSHTLHRYPRHH